MRHVVLDASFITDIDASAEVALREVVEGLRERNIELHVARASAALRHRLDEVGLTELIGPTTCTAPSPLPSNGAGRR